MKKGDLLLFGETAETNENNKTTIDDEASNFDGLAADTNLKNLLKKLSVLLGTKDESIEELSRIAGRNSLRRQIELRASEERKRALFNTIQKDAELLSLEYEDFDLKQELLNSDFKMLINFGFPLKKAYEFVHFEELMKKSRLEGQREAYEMVIMQLQDGAFRPEENGITSTGGVVEKKSVSMLSGRGIRDIIRRVEKGAKIKF